MQAERDQRAKELAERLRSEGHGDAADRVDAAVHGSGAAAALRFTLDEACQWVLTAVEALDPRTAAMAEELRLEADKRLR